MKPRPRANRTDARTVMRFYRGIAVPSEHAATTITEIRAHGLEVRDSGFRVRLSGLESRTSIDFGRFKGSSVRT